MSIDLEQLEIVLRKNIETPDTINIEWQLQEIDKESFIDFIMGEFGECLKQLETQEKAEGAIRVISSEIYYYQFGYENKFTKKSKDEFRRYENSIKNKVTSLISVLYDDFQSDTPQIQLFKLLKDMEKTPFKYAKVNKEIPPHEYNKNELIEHSIMMFSYKFNDNKCVNIIKKIYKKLPFNSND